MLSVSSDNLHRTNGERPITGYPSESLTPPSLDTGVWNRFCEGLNSCRKTAIDSMLFWKEKSVQLFELIPINGRLGLIAALPVAIGAAGRRAIEQGDRVGFTLVLAGGLGSMLIGSDGKKITALKVIIAALAGKLLGLVTEDIVLLLKTIIAGEGIPLLLRADPVAVGVTITTTLTIALAVGNERISGRKAAIMQGVTGAFAVDVILKVFELTDVTVRSTIELTSLMVMGGTVAGLLHLP
jgi:hypothetical protein